MAQSLINHGRARVKTGIRGVKGWFALEASEQEISLFDRYWDVVSGVTALYSLGLGVSNRCTNCKAIP